MAAVRPNNRFLDQYAHRASFVDDAGALTAAEPAALTSAAITGTITGTPNGAIADIAAIAITTAGGNTYADAATNTAVNTAITALNGHIEEFQVQMNLDTDDLTELHAQIAALVVDLAAIRTTLNALLLALKNARMMRGA